MDGNTTPEKVLISPWKPSFNKGLSRLMNAQRARDPGWPPEYAWDLNLLDWLAGPADLTRLIAHRAPGEVLGHVGAGTPGSANNASIWARELDCQKNQLAEICRLIVTPETRRLGLSGLLTKSLVRTLVDNGLIPVATALVERQASVKMMTSIGWRIIGTQPSEKTGLQQHLLIAPEKLVGQARLNRRQQVSRTDTTEEQPV